MRTPHKPSRRSIFRSGIVAILLLGCLGFTSSTAIAGGGLVANDKALRLGLTRAWFSQAQLDPTRHQVQGSVLHGDQLFVLTTASVLHVMDAHTGQTIWVTRLGNPDYPTFGPAVNGEYVALVNGSTLFVLRRSDGHEVHTAKLDGGVGGGPAITDSYVYVPLLSGKMEARKLDDPKQPSWYYASVGHVFDAATASPTSVMWPTDRGYMYFANTKGNGVRFRFQSTSRLLPHPVVQDGTAYLAAAGGYVYALQEQSGEQIWRYSLGEPMELSPMAIGNRIYATSTASVLHCLHASNGDPVWRAHHVQQFVSASKSRIYGINRLGDIMILDATSGVPQGRLKTSIKTKAIHNDQTDRLYLISKTGLVQCLHEIGQEEPYVHSEQEVVVEEEPVKRADPPAFADPGNQPAPVARPAAPAEDNPFGDPSDSGSGSLFNENLFD